MIKLLRAIKYAYIFNKASKLASLKKYEDSYELIREIDSNKLKGKSKFRVSLLEAVLLYTQKNYQLSKQMMEHLYTSVERVSKFNDSEIDYMRVFIIEQYKLLKDVLDFKNEVIPEEVKNNDINLELVSNNIKDHFPISKFK